MERSERDQTATTTAASPVFATTHWTVVLAAAQKDSPAASAALERLCRTYQYPIYAYIRRHGYTHHDAEDCRQAFLARLVEKNFLADVRRERGKFRWFLQCALKRFLANEWHKDHAAKRGGRAQIVSLDDDTSDERYRLEIPDRVTPETLLHRSWATTLLDEAEKCLRARYEAKGKAAIFDQLKAFLASDKGSTAYAEAAGRLGVTPAAVATLVHRLRKEYRECVRAQVAPTVSTAAEIDEEMRSLFAALSG